MIPRFLHQTCVRQTWEERKLAQKARRLMPDWDYRLYSDDDNAELLRAVLPEYEQQYLQLPHGVIRADIARCLYLYRYGGVYFDTDYKFLKPFPADLLAERCVLGVEEELNSALGRPKLGNAIMCSEKGFPVWLEFVRSVFARFGAGESDVVFMSGPHALTLFLDTNRHFSSDVRILSSPVLYPDFDRFKLSAVEDERTVGVHLCWGSWRNKSLVQTARNRLRRIASATL